MPRRQEGKITSKVNLFKGKRLVEDTKDPAEEENEGVDILVGETEGGVDETPDWLLNATKKNGNSIIDDTSDDIEVPRKDVGQNKPFKFWFCLLYFPCSTKGYVWLGLIVDEYWYTPLISM